MKNFALLLLLWMGVPACAPLPSLPADRVVVLYSVRDDDALTRPACAEQKGCQAMTLESFACTPEVESAQTVIVTGHSLPPLYLHQSPEALARVLRCLQPQLVVLDTCYGFSAPLLDAMLQQGLAPLILGATYRLPPEGLRYDGRFFARGLSAHERAALVDTRSGAHLSRWQADAGQLSSSLTEARSWSREELTRHLQRVRPNLVRVPLVGTEERVLELVAPERFRP
ncbi:MULTISPECIES: hypothetical protein [unclassified Corallococcus]|uniref:hypothetical protein n=1 Tax=unclassified Corallococcus TaxID=2685029 RepID=UPI001A8E659F|nr:MULTISPECIES: hypothetical protein [unclassified Corallococcus]MBN9686395.1 hypothetical protein [Corallococcus sp. NCSPR001]WAS82178.1 hypothetical protein O0N60_22935 [Corallococcus sp. NCRR]